MTPNKEIKQTPTVKRFAVTGGIGSGKSAFCACLKQLGFPVFSCDDISRGLWQEKDYRAGIAARFPQYAEGDEPQRQKLSEAVFRDEGLLAELNAYAHPRIMERLLRETEGLPVCFAEVPLLFEGKYEGLFDGVIVVMRERSARIESVRKRDGNKSDVLARMARQVDYDALDLSNYIVVANNGTEEELMSSAREIVKQLGL
ncbi:MAG: dephospho-CoA kinase [Clostridia bacterium]|nr:dephospho-CoA kinase [Clostridia bacterium]